MLPATAFGLADDTTRSLLCGDLFTQGGEGKAALVESDILRPSEAFRGTMDYYSHTPDTTGMLERLAGRWRGAAAGVGGIVEQRRSKMA